MTLGEKLRFYRTAERYTQGTIAEMLGMERSTYTYYETDSLRQYCRSFQNDAYKPEQVTPRLPLRQLPF